jgi:TonB-dependent SusC/RagA subfamily outer membrane receptor
MLTAAAKADSPSAKKINTLSTLQLADVTIKGIVADSNGVTIPGATIKVKSTGKAAVTNTNGEFTISVPSPNEVLVVSFIGYKTREVALHGRTSIRVVLVDQNAALNEVVVIGYGTVKKRDLTGAVSSVKGSDIAMNPVSNPVEALQGRVSGLDIQRTSGNAGASPSILLRGNRSITAGGDPLYIVDGIQGSITALNPDDIESIDVLKDASSTAIYGSAGANGVIIVATKKQRLESCK